MTLPEIHHIVSTQRSTIAKHVKLTAKCKLGQTLQPDDLEDLISDAIMILLEKLDSGTKKMEDFSNGTKVLHYVITTACRKLKGDHNRQRVAKKNYSDEEYTENYLMDNSQVHEPEISTADFYQNVLEFVYSRYSEIEAGIFKTFAVNHTFINDEGKKVRMTYSRLNEITGYNRNRVYYIVKKIREDIKKNIDHILKFSKRNIDSDILQVLTLSDMNHDSYTVAQAIDQEYRLTTTTTLAQTVLEFTEHDYDLRMDVLEMPYQAFLELYR